MPINSKIGQPKSGGYGNERYVGAANEQTGFP